MKRNVAQEEKTKITYANLFWLFIFGSLIGVILEGVFCCFHYGHWETHVVSVWGPFCIIYGFGVVGFYLCNSVLKNKKLWVQFVTYCAIGFSIELICGALLEFGLHMRAWNYSSHFMNIRGYVSLSMTVVWGIVGIVFSKLVPYMDAFLSKIEGKGAKIICFLLTIFMVVNLTVTASAIWRWKERHFDVPATSSVEEFLDDHYDDEFMEERFCEWRFLK